MQIRATQRRHRRLVRQIQAVQRLVQQQQPRRAPAPGRSAVAAARRPTARPIGRLAYALRTDQLDRLRHALGICLPALSRTAPLRHRQRHAPAVAVAARAAPRPRRAAACPRRTPRRCGRYPICAFASPAGRARAPSTLPALSGSIAQQPPSAASTCPTRSARAARRTRRPPCSCSPRSRRSARRRSRLRPAQLDRRVPSARYTGYASLHPSRLIAPSPLAARASALRARSTCHCSKVSDAGRERLGHGRDRDAARSARSALTRCTSGRDVLAVEHPHLDLARSPARSTVCLSCGGHVGALGDRLREAVRGQQLQPEVFAERLEDALAVADRHARVARADLRCAAGCSARAPCVSKRCSCAAKYAASAGSSRS